MRIILNRARFFAVAVAAFLIPIRSAAAADVTLIPAGAIWKYLDNGTDQGTAWRAAGFDDSSWASGAAQLGYGDGDEATVVNSGPGSKYITTYFRRSFDVADPAAAGSLALRTLRDDGAVVYLNGTEVWRSNMPAGAIGYQTLAAVAVGLPQETTFYGASVDPALLVAGTNVLAVEIHQVTPASSDISFDLELVAAPVTVTRGPYLQLGTDSAVRVRWRTSAPTTSRVRYGTTPGNLSLTAGDAASITEHELALTGLSPAVTYYYSVGSATEMLAGDTSYFFVTSPPPAGTGPTRIWVLGDSGTANSDAAAVRDAYVNFTGTTHTNLWLMLGDNAYQSGTDAEYQAAVFDMYPAMLRKSVLWPTIGNHDTANLSTAPPGLPYFQMFSLPAAAEAGGVSSGTEKYYAFDYANIHFICLDSMTSDRSTTGPMLTWLRDDLASTTKQWIIAFWHHPPYSKGSHDSDTTPELIEMRQNALPILEDYGVDLVLTGHSHSYERSFLIDSHYGLSGSFVSSMKKDGGSGRPDGSGAYEKVIGPHAGAVYAVAGSSGKVAPGTFDHPAMFISLGNLGSMVLDVAGGRMDVKFLRETGAAGDYFTLVKVLLATPGGVNARATAAAQVTIDWSAVPNATGYEIQRREPGHAFAPVGTATTPSYVDNAVSSGVSYLYSVRAVNAGGTSSLSAADVATTILFTDDALAPGTRIKAAHLAELRSAVNAVRALAGLSSVSFDDSVMVSAAHVTELRNALDAALAALQRGTGGYTGAVAAGVPIRAVHLQEIRDRVK
jgi:hypothetical protein